MVESLHWLLIISLYFSFEVARMEMPGYCEKLAEYEYGVVYKAGKTNENSAALSRNPVGVMEIEDTAEIFTTCHEKKKKLTDEEIIKLLESEDEDGCSNASIQGDEISQNFLTRITRGLWFYVCRHT